MDRWRCHPQKPLPGHYAPAVNDAARAECVRQELRRILGSDQFRASLRLKHFLHFVVEMMLAGNSAGIKAYTIAVDALGRGADFDPQRDPIVRVEAARLRQALARYYAAAGRDDELVIDLPRGTYVPLVRRAVSEPSAPAESGTGPRETPLAKTWWELIASHRREALLQKRLSWELGEQIRSMRRTLDQSKALLRQHSDFQIICSPADCAASPAQSGPCPTEGILAGDNPSISAGEFSRLMGYGLA
ncbi:MAG: hypothetical protein WBF58_06975 [Xanthobacteraceae bacterium]